MIPWKENMAQDEWDEMIQERTAMFDAELAEMIKQFGVKCWDCGRYISHCRRNSSQVICSTMHTPPLLAKKGIT